MVTIYFVTISIYPYIHKSINLSLCPYKNYQKKQKYIIHSICLYLGGTSLMLAAMNDHTDTVRILLEYGADVNTKNVYGKLHTY